MRTFKVGDLLIRERDQRPCVVVGARDSPHKEWGTIDANRRQYKLFDGTDSEQWYTDTVIHATFSIPTP